MKTGKEFADCALSSNWDVYTYDELDCQAFVEAVLKRIGVRKADGSVYNWAGSNSMFRTYYAWHGTIEDCIKAFGCLPVGAFVYVHKDDGEPERYKKDGLGNFSHVGIYCGNDIVRDSTRSTKTKRNGVGTRSLEGFTYASLFIGLDYTNKTEYTSEVEKVYSLIDRIHNDLIELEGTLNELLRG